MCSQSVAIYFIVEFRVANLYSAAVSRMSRMFAMLRVAFEHLSGFI
jgi:hypothetical protein